MIDNDNSDGFYLFVVFYLFGVNVVCYFVMYFFNSFLNVSILLASLISVGSLLYSCALS